MDRSKNNRRLREIIAKHRSQQGSIPALSAVLMERDLIALFDEVVEKALGEGYEEARQQDT